MANHDNSRGLAGLDNWLTTPPDTDDDPDASIHAAAKESAGLAGVAAEMVAAAATHVANAAGAAWTAAQAAANAAGDLSTARGRIYADIGRIDSLADTPDEAESMPAAASALSESRAEYKRIRRTAAIAILMSGEAAEAVTNASLSLARAAGYAQAAARDAAVVQDDANAVWAIAGRFGPIDGDELVALGESAVDNWSSTKANTENTRAAAGLALAAAAAANKGKDAEA